MFPQCHYCRLWRIKGAVQICTDLNQGLELYNARLENQQEMVRLFEVFYVHTQDGL